MPFITVELLEGRSEEQLKKIVEEVTEVVATNANAPKENIHVFIKELKKERYAVAGKLKSES
ncbi:4-oxalocrotonate tautomerase [Macrococcus epidermidis]|uniref:Tautomerase n=2 Tax=Staphylococcaceae TaxID=90964 RepID=A0A2G5NSF2_9STAP|nr:MULTISPECIES: 2-hydroxymuconate tautomerase [Macrococcus]MCG7420023.1 4-oxalocrotonate tautomerase [Macrococcus epidermidis]MCH4984672.1 4-oxalocrotonate tautomerase [Macrococcus sp. PK]RAI82695.1 4-oxalocrotonate tautomerase [Macrococcus goetzii]RAK46645.1 4-oxalocrotonate tautomerase [Macrococcus epidermidis]TDM42333.1 4-oxalocrotonate tautomerase [Macrococcus goetzii]